tara:strand:+ start:825 stop:1742 length:918 start_codon:yes stop_codon:yes gene_type:complete
MILSINPIKIVLAPTADLAATVDAHVTVEAEYGSIVATGSVYTAAHHQKGMENLPAPCEDMNIPVLEDGGTVLVSHLDLDTIGGCLRALGSTLVNDDTYASFWKLAGFVDVNGPHKLAQANASEKDLSRLYAFWAWKQANVGRTSQDECTDVTDLIWQAEGVLDLILDGGDSNDYGSATELLAAGAQMRADEAALNRSTFVEAGDNVIVRVTSFDPADGQGFCNHLYVDTDGKPYAAVVAFAKCGGSITISLADAPEGVSCREVMQDMFGPEAGGHNGIAGSPRNERMSLRSALNVASRLESLLG